MEAEQPPTQHLPARLSFSQRSFRVRSIGDKAVVTIKGQRNGATRQEFEFPIPVQECRQILDQLCLKPLINKMRYQIRQNGNNWEIDEYADENAGLMIAETPRNRIFTSRTARPYRKASLDPSRNSNYRRRSQPNCYAGPCRRNAFRRSRNHFAAVDHKGPSGEPKSERPPGR